MHILHIFQGFFFTLYEEIVGYIPYHTMEHRPQIVMCHFQV